MDRECQESFQQHRLKTSSSPAPVAMASAHLPALSVMLCALALILYNTPAGKPVMSVS